MSQPGLETGLNRYKSKNKNKIKTEIQKNWKPILTLKPKQEKKLDTGINFKTKKGINWIPVINKNPK